MVSLAPPPKSWTDAVAAVANQFMNARVCFFASDDDGYNPVTNLPGSSSVNLLWVGNARVQHLRSPQPFATDYQAGATRPFRFQAGKDAGVPFLQEGVRARVLGFPETVDGMLPGDPHLEQLLFVVNSAINASHSAVKTVEATAVMRPVTWTWTVDDSGAVIPSP